MHGADHVAEAAVLGAGEDQEGEAELVDETQPLHRLAVDQRRLQRIGTDEAVHRIADRQHAGGGGRGQLRSGSVSRRRKGRSRSITCWRLLRIESTESPRSGSDSVSSWSLRTAGTSTSGGDAVDQLLEGAVGGGQAVDVDRQLVPSSWRSERSRRTMPRRTATTPASCSLSQGSSTGAHQRLPVGAGDLALEL